MEEAYKTIDPNTQMLLAASSDEGHSFGAAIDRDDAGYELAARMLLEQGNPMEQSLWNLMRGGVEPQDELAMTVLVYAVARKDWLDRNMTEEQVAAAHVILEKPGMVSCDLYPRSDA